MSITVEHRWVLRCDGRPDCDRKLVFFLEPDNDVCEYVKAVMELKLRGWKYSRGKTICPFCREEEAKE